MYINTYVDIYCVSICVCACVCACCDAIVECICYYRNPICIRDAYIPRDGNGNQEAHLLPHPHYSFTLKSGGKERGRKRGSRE